MARLQVFQLPIYSPDDNPIEKRGSVPVTGTSRFSRSECLQTKAIARPKKGCTRYRDTTEYREVIILRELEGLSYKDIVAIADLPVGTVMSRLARARKRLQ
jgi:hypothetical protein